MKCIKCEQEKPIGIKGVCLSCIGKVTVEMSRTDLEAIMAGGAAPVEINAVDPAKLNAALAKPTNGVTSKSAGKLQTCDNCEKQAILTSFGKLNLCAKCFIAEQEAAAELDKQAPEYDRANYRTWPRCKECQAHVVKENLEANEGVCTNCARKQNKKVELSFVKPTDSNKYQEFFNAETQSIVEMLSTLGDEQGILQLRANIIDGDELLSKEEAAAFKTKTLQQARKVKYNDMLSKLSLDEQKALRIEDASYKPKSGEPRKLKSPLASEADKVKKLKKSLDEQINAMFGGKLSTEEIEQKKKALGM